MLFSEIFSGSAVSVDATERSLMANGGTTSGVPQAIDGARWYRLIAKFASIVAADNFKFRVYRAPASGATQEVIDEFHVSFAMSRQITYYWEARYDTDVTVQRISANSRNLTWSIEACDQAPTAAEIATAVAATIAATIADAVWDEAIAGHVAAGSTGEALTAGGGGGGATVDDILNEPLAGHAGAGTVGAALIASRDGVGTLTTAIDAVPTNAELATALAPLALSTQVDTVEASLATLAAAVADVPTNAELATALDPIATAAEVTADGDATRARLPAALVSGRIDASVGAMAANTMTAAAAAADLATELQSGLATTAGLAAAVAPLATTVGLAAAVAPLATSAEVSALDAVVDAIGAALSAAVASVQADTDALQTGQAGLTAGVATALTDIDDVQARLPAALVGGRMDSSVGAMAANVMTAAAAAADLGTELAAAIAGSLSIPTAAQVRDAILDYSHGTGVIVRGLLERLETLAAGRWTGLRGATATGYARDGVTPVVEMAQNVPLGTREQWPGSDV